MTKKKSEPKNAELSIKISLLHYQAKFIEVQKNSLYCAFVGGVGTGKSHTLTVGAFLDMLHSPDALIGIYGPTYRHVNDVCLPYLLKLLADNGFKKGKDENSGDFHVNKAEMRIISHHPQLGSAIFKSTDDPATIIGYQTYTAHVDELDTMPADKAEAAWYAIMARTRQWPNGLDPKLMHWNGDFVCSRTGVKGRLEPRNKVCAYTTPEGFKFTYKTWVQDRLDNPDKEYCIVTGQTKDNPFNASTYYTNMLKKYPGPLAKAYLEGEFVNLATGSIYYAYDPSDDRHRGAHDSDETIQPNETLFIGMDFNIAKMAATTFVKRYKNQKTEWHVVDELRDLYDTPEMIETLKKRYKDHRIIIYPDASGKNRNAANGAPGQASIAQLREAGFEVRVDSANPGVKDTIMAVNKGFLDNILFVNQRKCPKTLMSLVQQAYDKEGRPDKTSGDDHGNDTIRYVAAKEFPVRPRLFSVPIKWIA